MIFFLDRDHNPVDESEATEFIIWECREDGEIIMTTRGMMRP